MPAEGLSSLGSLSGGVCGAAAALAPALLAAARGAARQRLGVSAGDARLGVAVGGWPGEEGIDVQDTNVLPLLSASAAAEGTVALAAAALAGATALPPLTLALAAGLSLPLRLASVFAMASPPPLPVLLASAGLAAAALALSAAQRLCGQDCLSVWFRDPHFSWDPASVRTTWYPCWRPHAEMHEYGEECSTLFQRPWWLRSETEPRDRRAGGCERVKGCELVSCQEARANTRLDHVAPAVPAPQVGICSEQLERGHV